jgi:hypothetical protein
MEDNFVKKMNHKGVCMKLDETTQKIKPVKMKKNALDHSGDPFFVKKLEAAKKRLDKVVLPAELVNKK